MPGSRSPVRRGAMVLQVAPALGKLEVWGRKTEEVVLVGLVGLVGLVVSKACEKKRQKQVVRRLPLCGRWRTARPQLTDQ